MINFKGRIPSGDDMMKAIIKEAINVQKKFVQSQYPEITDFDITYNFAEKKFHYTGLSLDQIKKLPGVSETGG